jgi:hypothetical protein
MMGFALATPGFYGGAGWQVLGRLPVLGVRFGAYEIITAYITGNWKLENVAHKVVQKR